MATIEKRAAGYPLPEHTLLAHLVGRIVPHVLVMSYLMYFLSEAISTIRGVLWLFFIAYAAFTVAHTFMVRKRLRLWIILAATALAGMLMAAVIRLAAAHGESGMYTANVITLFLTILLWFSAINNTLFLRVRLYYWFELLLLNAVWIVVVLSRLETSIQTIFILTLPVLLYSLYILVFRYLLDTRMPGHDRRKVYLRFVFVLVALIIGILIAYVSGVGVVHPAASTGYSLLSKKNERYTVEDKARLEDELKVPLDSKELVLVANIDPIAGRNIGYYLKFHSLYNYDPLMGEFNMRSDEMEDPRFQVRRMSLKGTLNEPTNLIAALDGSAAVPNYAFRTDGRSTIYNVKLDMDQTFGHNLTYRFVSYANQDSIAVADRMYPLLGIYRLFSKISVLNVYPLGVGGRQYDDLLLGAITRYQTLDATPQSFKQPYLNTTGLEPDIVATFRDRLKGCTTIAQKLSAVIAYFRQRGPDGRPLFVYDLKPGKPDLPGETRLHHFLMTTKRGYCTYYATAAAMFLRVAGLPSRVAIGFATDEGSERNPGWYYIYTFQGHAWVETYLGDALGWIDIDVTPGSDANSPGIPPPDPTPPAPPMPLEPQLHLNGVVRNAPAPLSVSKRLLRWKDEERDSVLCATTTSNTVVLIFDTTYRKANPAETESHRAAVEATVRGLRANDSILVVGRASVNPAARSCNLTEFRYHGISRIGKDAKDTLKADAPRRGGRAWWKNPLLYVIAGCALLLLVLSSPTLRLFWLRRKALRVRHEGRRLELTREWLFLRMQLCGWTVGMETDREYAVRLALTEGYDVRRFIDAWLRFRYFDDVEEMHQPVCRRLMAETESFIRRKKGLVKWRLSRFNLWQFIRYVNRRQTL